MKHILFSISFLCFTIASQSQNFNNEPWKQEAFPIILDVYSLNRIDFSKVITDKKVAGIIHKSSQGLSKDMKYAERLKEAKAKGLGFGSYHLGTSEDPIKQAEFYLNCIKLNPNDLMALDIEDFEKKPSSNKPYMPLENAIKFIKHIKNKTGNYPLLYINHKVFSEINKRYSKTSVFAKCKLWYARFRTQLPPLSKKIWDKVTIWQFSSEINCQKTDSCLYNVPGTIYDMDVNSFNGSILELKKIFNIIEKDNTSFIKRSLKYSNKFTKDKVCNQSDFSCGIKDVYFIKDFNADGELKGRFIVFKKSNQYSMNEDFIWRCAEQIGLFTLPELDDSAVDYKNKHFLLSSMSMKYEGGCEFTIGFHTNVPENTEVSNVKKYISFIGSNDVTGYVFPTLKDCNV